ncbi:IKK1 [Trypoxylus dichotomus]
MDEPKEIGDWLMICVLGAGAFGKVSLWRNKVNDEYIAVKKCKFMLPDHLTKRQRERWINEVDIMKTLANENIVAYKELPSILKATFEKYNPTRLPILSMEYCTKGNLRKLLLQTKNLMGCDEEDVRCILKDVSNAVAYLHSKNITHRDIKPENIVIQDYEGRPSRHLYKLIDLGYAKELETLASFVGTLPYLAPEIFCNNSYNCSVDYWSLGILTYEMITGVHPFLPNKTPVES